jgi:circadian clock protein KaiC
MSERVPVGIPGIDKVLHGGLFAGRSYMLAGCAGTGKTIFSLQWLLDGVRLGHKGLFVTLTEPAEDLEDNVRSFGWSLDALQVEDLTPGDTSPAEVADEYQIFPPSEVEQRSYWQGIYDAVEKHKPERLVIDSLTQLRYVATDEFQFRKNVLHLVTFLRRAGCTAFLLYEPIEMFKDTSVALAVDGIFRLRMEISAARAIGLRDFQVEKMRGSGFLSGMHPLEFTSNGIEVYPHVIEELGPTSPAKAQAKSGVPELDELLAGGLETGTTTIFTGPSGVGKSTICSLFARHAALQGERVIYYSFEESLESLQVRSRGLGIDIQPALDSGLFRFEHVNPMELYPDQFLWRVRDAIEYDGRTLVVIDSLRGYEIAMHEYGSPAAHLHNLTTYLSRKSVTTLITNVADTIAGELHATEMRVSHLADNIVLLRYSEFNSRIIKVIGCLKKRVGSFQPELREYLLTPQSIRVGPMLTGLRGILTGTPSFEGAIGKPDV